MAFTFAKCFSPEGFEIQGLYEIQPKVYGDKRGYFFECYNERVFSAAGLNLSFVQDNQSSSAGGVLRGLHFQMQHPQGKLVRAVSGKVYDVAVDLRTPSPTFGTWYGVILDGEKQNQFYIPKGFAHGFFVLSESAVFAYKCTDFYHPEDEAGLPYNDALLNINWPAANTDFSPILSEKDTKYPSFRKDKTFFDMDGKWIANNMSK